MIDNTEQLLRAKREQISGWILKSWASFLVVVSLSLVYLVPTVLRNKKLDQSFLQFAKDYPLGFSYEHDILINAVVAVYFTLIYPYVFVFSTLIMLLAVYKFNLMKNIIRTNYIIEDREDLFLFLGLVCSFLLFIWGIYYSDPSPPVLYQHQAYFKSRIFFAVFLFGSQATMISFFLFALFNLIDTFVYLFRRNND